MILKSTSLRTKELGSEVQRKVTTTSDYYNGDAINTLMISPAACFDDEPNGLSIQIQTNQTLSSEGNLRGTLKIYSWARKKTLKTS